MSPIRAKIAVRLACPCRSVIIAPILAWFIAYFLLADYHPIDTYFAFALYHRVDIPDFHQDSYLKVLRPLVEPYLAFARGVLDRLEAKGLIQRDEVEADRRRTTIQLTEKGQHLFKKVFPTHVAFLRPFFEHALNPSEAEADRTLLLCLCNSFQRSS
ncbi:MarR family winged helix-turn-helix transcriptional regulator [Nitrospira sp. Nam74]